MDLPFFAADTLGVTLYQVGSQLVANETHQVRFGPWRVELPVDVSSDVSGGAELGFWVTLAKRLQLYVIIKERENWLFVLDKDKLKECEKTGFVGRTVKERVKEIKPAITDVFHWVGNGWERVARSSDKVG
jgi:hypothetical protein